VAKSLGLVMRKALMTILLCSCANRPERSADTKAPAECGAHEEAAACASDPQGCRWMPNTRPCQLNADCRAVWCYKVAPTAPAQSADNSCSCPDSSNALCVEIAGSISCRSPPTGCTLPDRCACLFEGAVTCHASVAVANLCVCER